MLNNPSSNNTNEQTLLQEISYLRAQMRELKNLLLQSQHELIGLRSRIDELETHVRRINLKNELSQNI